MTPQLAAISIAAKDLPLMREFYINTFGWKIQMENPKIVILQLDNIQLSLLTEELFNEYTGAAPSPGQNFYFTINVDNPAIIDAKFAGLSVKGVNIIKAPERVFWGGYRGIFADIEGNLWEIACK